VISAAFIAAKSLVKSFRVNIESCGDTASRRAGLPRE
jgi:hypothetical protein